MQKVSLELSSKQAEQLADQLLDRLDEPAKLRLTQKLEQAGRRARWEPLVQAMRHRVAHRPLSAAVIRRLCEQVRQEHFEQRLASRRR